MANISVLHGVLMATAASVAGCARLHTDKRRGGVARTGIKGNRVGKSRCRMGIKRDSGTKIERACSGIKNAQQLKQSDSEFHFVFKWITEIEWPVTCEKEN